MRLLLLFMGTGSRDCFHEYAMLYTNAFTWIFFISKINTFHRHINRSDCAHLSSATYTGKAGSPYRLM